MKTLIKKLTDYLTELLTGEDMLLVNRIEFEKDMKELTRMVEYMESSVSNIYIDESNVENVVKDAVENLMYDLSLDLQAEDNIEGLSDLVATCKEAEEKIKAMKNKYNNHVNESK